MGFDADKHLELTLKLNELKDNLPYIDAADAYRKFLEIELEFADNDLPFKMNWESFCKEQLDEDTSYDDYDEYDSY